MAELIKGWDSLMAKLSAMGGNHLQEAAVDAVTKLALATSAAAKMLITPDTGELRNSIRTDTEVDGSQAISYCYTNVEHAPYVEFGTGPIGAASGGNGSDVQVHYSLGPFLVRRGTGRPGEVVESYEDYWVYCDHEGNFFATRGQPARPYMYPASQQVRKQAAEIMKKAVKAYIASTTGGR